MTDRTDDWFLPAVQGHASVESSLDAVLKAQEAKLYFVKALKLSLKSKNPLYSDSLTSLKSDLGIIRQTLDFRLGILEKSRSQAWFRPTTAAELGPFPSKVSFAAILPKLSAHNARRARNELVQLWSQRLDSGANFPKGDYLWSSLLTLNRQWDSICQLAEPYHDLRLDELPEGLPDEISSPSLKAYLFRVGRLVASCRLELDQCFQKFFKVTEKFLLNYYDRPVQEEAKAPPYRQGGRQISIRDSLLFMNFQGLPDVKILKKRYFELAKLCHPDSPIGSNERFQTLRFHYERILREVQISS